jgi:hypothetical protein
MVYDYGIGKTMGSTEYKSHIGKYQEREEIPLFTQKEMQLEMCLDRHLRRSPKSIMLDDRLIAKTRFKPTFLKGIQLWMKNPNRYDVIGVDYFLGIHKKGRRRRR